MSRHPQAACPAGPWACPATAHAQCTHSRLQILLCRVLMARQTSDAHPTPRLPATPTDAQREGKETAAVSLRRKLRILTQPPQCPGGPAAAVLCEGFGCSLARWVPVVTGWDPSATPVHGARIRAGPPPIDGPISSPLQDRPSPPGRRGQLLQLWRRPGRVLECGCQT